MQPDSQFTSHATASPAAAAA